MQPASGPDRTRDRSRDRGRSAFAGGDPALVILTGGSDITPPETRYHHTDKETCCDPGD